MNEGKSIDGFAKVAPVQQPQQPVSSTPHSNKSRKLAKAGSFVVSTLITLALIAGTAAVFIVYKNIYSSPVPKNISKQLDFPVYYPDQKKLPKGYLLNASSFKIPQQGVLLYSIDYGNNKRLVFSVQKQPSDDEIQAFYANYIPLRNKIHTVLGDAEIGARNTQDTNKPITQTVVSMPTNKGSWVILTAPYDINQNDLKQTLNSLKN